MTIAQRGLVVLQVLMPEAEAEAREHQGERADLDRGTSAPIGAEVESAQKASKIAAERSLGLASARTLERMQPVRHAPCDVSWCDGPAGGSRTFTFIRQDEPPLSVLVRLCALHTDTPREQLLPLLPALDGMVTAAGNVPFADLGEDLERP